jgi:hypothetical protein
MGQVPKAEKDAFYAMLSRPYWTRLWVGQEVCTSEESTLVHGEHEIKWRSLLELHAQGGARRFHDYPSSLLELVNRTYDYIDRQGRFFFHMAEFPEKSQCENLLDKIYGIQSLLDQRARIGVDYSSSPREVYMATVEKWYSLVGCHDRVAHGFSWYMKGYLSLAKAMLPSESMRHDEVRVNIENILQVYDNDEKLEWKEVELLLLQYVLEPAVTNVQNTAVEARMAEDEVETSDEIQPRV